MSGDWSSDVCSSDLSLLALYDKLSPEQKAVLDRPMMGRGMGRHRRHG